MWWFVKGKGQIQPLNSAIAALKDQGLTCIVIVTGSPREGISPLRVWAVPMYRMSSGVTALCCLSYIPLMARSCGTSSDC